MKISTSNDSTISAFISTFISAVIAVVLSLFVDVIKFGINWFLAEFIITPIIGAQVCFALNTVFNTTVFTKDILPVLYATACFVGCILFKSKLKIEKD